MQTEVSVMLTKWLAGTAAPGKGLNDFIPNVPRLAIDAAAPPPNILTFANPYEDDKCADFFAGVGDGTPSKLNAVYVMPEGPAQSDGEAGVTFIRYPDSAFVVRIILRKSKMSQAGRYAEYYGRAARMSIAAWLDDDATAQAGRTMGDLYVESATRQLDGPWAEDVGEAIALWVLALGLAVRDRKPRG
jgi:hypothetical protein